MATIKTLTWNIENWGPTSIYDDGGKAGNGNSSLLDFYISYIVYAVNPDIVSFLELNYGIASTKLRKIAQKSTAIYNDINNTNETNLWKAFITNSNQRGESYAVMYKKDAAFAPLFTDGSTAYVKGTNRYIYGLASQDALGGELDWPIGNDEPEGGRKPFYIVFKTTDQATAANNVVFSFIAYHASAPSNQSGEGLTSIANLGVLTGTDKTNPDTAITANLITGDFNVNYAVNQDAYDPILNLPSYPATDQLTSLKAVAPQTDQDNSLSYRASAYDNIFQKVPQADSNTGTVLDLLKASAKYSSGGVQKQGKLYTWTQRFDPELFIRRAYRDAVLPADDMLDAWKFVRGGISDHLPVYVTTEIKNE